MNDHRHLRSVEQLQPPEPANPTGGVDDSSTATATPSDVPARPVDLQLAAAVAGAFDARRLRQARLLAGRTKRDLADALHVTPGAVSHWETGTTLPRPDHVVKLAVELDVPVGFFAAGRPYAVLDAGDAHFRSLRSTPAYQRRRAVEWAEQVWEVAHALEHRVHLPPVDLPGYTPGDGVLAAGPDTTPFHAAHPQAAARELRAHWKLGKDPVAHLVRTMEKHGLIVTVAEFAGAATATVDAFSTSKLPRPVVVLTRERAKDVYRHRFTAAHELGHLLLHPDAQPGDPLQERQADAFAAEFLTPADRITAELPARMDLHRLDQLSRDWGVGVGSLIYRCREIGTISETTYRRSYQRLNQMRGLGLFPLEAVSGYPGEQPVLLTRACQVAEQHGLTRHALAAQLQCTLPRLRQLLGEDDRVPRLSLAPSTADRVEEKG